MFALMISFFACRKEKFGINTQLNAFKYDDFWSVSKGTPLTNTFITKIKSSKNAKSFEAYISEIGKPQWDHSMEYTTGTNLRTVTLPVIDEANQTTTAIIIVGFFEDDYKYNTVLRRSYYSKGKTLINQEQWQELFAGWDNEVFNKNTLPGKTISFKNNFSNQKSIQTKAWATEQIGTQAATVCVGEGEAQECGTTYYPIYGYVWVEDGGGSSSGGSSSGGSGTSSSAGPPTNNGNSSGYLDPNLAMICGYYDNIKVGNSYVGDVTNAGFVAHITTGGVSSSPNVSIGEMCFTVPASRGDINEATVSTAFTMAYNAALIQVDLGLRNGTILHNGYIIRRTFLAAVNSNLNVFSPGSSVIGSYCLNVPRTIAQRCLM